MTETKFDYDATLAEIKKIQQSNVDKIKGLLGSGRALDPAVVANIKIDTLVGMFDENTQAVYTLAMEKNIQKSLADALATLRQQDLVKGVAGAGKGGLILP